MGRGYNINFYSTDIAVCCDKSIQDYLLKKLA